MKLSALNDITTAIGVPGIVGAMYTTWNNNYDDLEAYAASIKANWFRLKP